MTTFEKGISKLLIELSPRARNVIRQRYGLGQSEALTLEAIGRQEGITRERVRQIESDSLRRLKKSDSFLALASFEKTLADTINSYGGVISENQLASVPEFADIKDKKSILFFVDLCDSITRKKGDDSLHVRFYTKDAPVSKVESALLVCARDLEKSKETLSENEMHGRLITCLKKHDIHATQPRVIASYIGLSKEIEKNAWGEYGHVESPFVRPRGMRESAFVALARAREPLHFREIAKRIGGFTSRPVHVQTVHNELIKDNRFVLVGRGLYALREWGYEPGFIKDVLSRILDEQGPMTREQILKEVSKRRQVKPSTVFINLQNKKLFKPLDDGTYTLLS